MRFSLARAGQVSYIQAMSTVLAPLNDEVISAESAGMRFGEVLYHAAHDKARVVLTHDGKPVAAIVPIEDYEALEAIEDAHDAQLGGAAIAAWEAAGRPRGVPLAEVAAELGIDLNAA